MSRRTLVATAFASAAVAGAGTAIAFLVTGSKGVTSLRSNATSVNAAAFSPDGKLLATGCSTTTGANGVNDGFAQVWDMPGGTSIATIRGQGNVVSVAFSPDGKTLAIGSDLGYLQLWDIAAATVTATYNMAGQGLGSGVASMAFSPDGTTLAAGTDDGDCNGVIQFWTLPGGSSTNYSVNGRNCGTDAGLNSVVFAANGMVISGGQDGAIWIWDLPSGKNTARWSMGAPVQALALSPDAKTLASGGGTDSSGLVRFWDVPSGTSRKAVTLGNGPVLSLAWSPDGRHVVSGGKDEVVRVWDAATFTSSSSFSVPCTYGVESVAFMPDSTTYIVCGAVGNQAMTWLKQVA